MYIQLFLMIQGHCFNFLSNNLVKLRNTAKIGEIPTIKSLFSREMKTTKVQNLFEHHHILVEETTMH